jgi:hypothetical protein
VISNEKARGRNGPLLVQVRTLECLIVPQDAMSDIALAHLCVFLSNLTRFFAFTDLGWALRHHFSVFD